MAVDLPDIDFERVAGGNTFERLQRLQRQTEVLGEVVERAHRQSAERDVLADQARGHGVERAVAARGHDCLAALRQRGLHRTADLLAVFDDGDRATCRDGFDVGPVLRQPIISKALACVAVEDKGGTPRHGVLTFITEEKRGGVPARQIANQTSPSRMPPTQSLK